MAKRINVRRKGKEGERQAAAILRKHFPGSFGRNRAGTAVDDLACPEYFPYSVEVKTEEARLHNLLFPTAKTIGWWKQAEAQAVKRGLKPLLCARVDGVWWCTVVPPSKWQRIGLYGPSARCGWAVMEEWAANEARWAEVLKEAA